jgi:TolB protein
MSEDGSGLTRLGPGEWPAWSPDGRRIVFSDPDAGLSVMNADGTGLTPLGVRGYRADWSHDGSRITFVGDCGVPPPHEPVCVMNADGTGLTRLVSAEGFYADPVWSPDGTMIAFSYQPPEWERQEMPTGGFPQLYELYVMRADGSDVHQLSDLATPRFRVSGMAPDWAA